MRAPVLLGGPGGVPKPWLVGLSRRDGRSLAHTITVAGGALVAAGIGAFWTTPLGDVPEVAKYALDAALLLLVALLTVTAVRRAEGASKR